jgi:hypothetical protein
MASETTKEATRRLSAAADDQHEREGAENHRPLEPTHVQQEQNEEQSLSLGDRADAFEQEHQACQAAAQSAIMHAIKAGELLLKAKSAREFGCTGGFHEWVKRNCQVSVREAQRHLRLATHRDILEKVDATRVSHWSIRGALRLITQELKLQSAASSQLESADETEDDQDHEVAADPAAIAHIDRCQRVRDLMRKRKMKAVEADLRMLVDRQTHTFVAEVVATAGKFGQQASQGRFESAGYDAETIAILLLRMAAERLRPEEAFAPSPQRGRRG